MMPLLAMERSPVQVTTMLALESDSSDMNIFSINKRKIPRYACINLGVLSEMYATVKAFGLK